MKFEVIDTKTNAPVNLENLLKEDWMKNTGGVFYFDFDDYYINSDGQIILLDDCGNVAYAPVDRLKFVPEARQVNYSGDGYADGYMVYDMAECPNCGFDFEQSERLCGCEYCPNCGQKLDWSIDNEGCDDNDE